MSTTTLYVKEKGTLDEKEAFLLRWTDCSNRRRQPVTVKRYNQPRAFFFYRSGPHTHDNVSSNTVAILHKQMTKLQGTTWEKPYLAIQRFSLRSGFLYIIQYSFFFVISGLWSRRRLCCPLYNSLLSAEKKTLSGFHPPCTVYQCNISCCYVGYFCL